MPAGSRRDHWRDPQAAREYEARRFATRLQRWKHRRDERTVLALLKAAGAVRTVLDLPCGTGRLLPSLRRSGYRVVGADISLEMLDSGRALRPGERSPLVQAEVGELPFRDGSFDAVVSMRFFFHLDAGEERRALAEMCRVARDGGVVLGQVRYRVTLKQANRWLRSRIGIRTRYEPSASAAAIRRQLQAAGLELVTLRPISRWFSDKAVFLARSPPAS